METAPARCALGECAHAATYPHSLIRVPERSITRTARDQTKTTEVVPAVTFVICLACGHWDGSGAKATCHCDCHRKT